MNETAKRLILTGLAIAGAVLAVLTVAALLVGLGFEFAKWLEHTQK